MKNNSHGMSLVEMIVSSGILSVSTVATISLLNNSNSAMMKQESHNEFERSFNSAYTALSNAQICEKAFTTVSKVTPGKSVGISLPDPAVSKFPMEMKNGFSIPGFSFVPGKMFTPGRVVERVDWRDIQLLVPGVAGVTYSSYVAEIGIMVTAAVTKGGKIIRTEKIPVANSSGEYSKSNYKTMKLILNVAPDGTNQIQSCFASNGSTGPQSVSMAFTVPQAGEEVPIYGQKCFAGAGVGTARYISGLGIFVCNNYKRWEFVPLIPTIFNASL